MLVLCASVLLLGILALQKGIVETPALEYCGLLDAPGNCRGCVDPMFWLRFVATLPKHGKLQGGGQYPYALARQRPSASE